MSRSGLEREQKRKRKRRTIGRTRCPFIPARHVTAVFSKTERMLMGRWMDGPRVFFSLVCVVYDTDELLAAAYAAAATIPTTTAMRPGLLLLLLLLHHRLDPSSLGQHALAHRPRRCRDHHCRHWRNGTRRKSGLWARARCRELLIFIL